MKDTEKRIVACGGISERGGEREKKEAKTTDEILAERERVNELRICNRRNSICHTLRKQRSRRNRVDIWGSERECDKQKERTNECSDAKCRPVTRERDDRPRPHTATAAA